MKRLAIMCVLVALLCVGSVWGEFVQNPNGTITDTNARLTWQGQGSYNRFYRDEVDNYLYGLGNGWRLPTGDELIMFRVYVVSKENNSVSGANYWTSEYDPNTGNPLALVIYHGDIQDPKKYNVVPKNKVLAVKNGLEKVKEKKNDHGCFICQLSFCRVPELLQK